MCQQPEEFLFRNWTATGVNYDTEGKTKARLTVLIEDYYELLPAS
jgi:hypothetical protein